MRYFCLLLLCCFWLSQPLSAKLVLTAEKYLFVREVGQNRGYWVEKFQTFVKIPKGSPWCAAFVSWVLEENRCNDPKTRSGLALAFVNKKSVKAKDVAKGYKKVSRNWLVIWKKSNTYKGHIGFVVDWNKNEGHTIEGNTGASNIREGDGVYRKQRKIVDAKDFRIEYFTPTEYAK